jgi:hypothetical protein
MKSVTAKVAGEHEGMAMTAGRLGDKEGAWASP